MGQKIAFATTNWKDRPGKPDGYSQAEWDAGGSSCFSGFPFPIFFGKKWTGNYSKELETYQAELQLRVLTGGEGNDPGYTLEDSSGIAPPVEVQSGWKEYDPASTPQQPLFIYPNVTVPQNAQSGCIVSKTERPLIIEGGGYLGPFSREDVTRLWWTARAVRTQSISTSNSANASLSIVGEFPPYGYDPDTQAPFPAEEFSVQASKAVSSPSSNFSPISPTNSTSELDAKVKMLSGIDGKQQQNSESQTTGYIAGPAQSEYTSEVLYYRVSASTSVTGSFSLGESVICDIDSPNDFYISFSAYAHSGSGGSWELVDFNYTAGEESYGHEGQSIAVSANQGSTYVVATCVYDDYADCRSQYSDDMHNMFRGQVGSAKVMVYKKSDSKFVQTLCNLSPEVGPMLDPCSTLTYQDIGSSNSSYTTVTKTGYFRFFDGKEVSFKMHGRISNSLSSSGGATLFYKELDFNAGATATLNQIIFHVKEYYEYDDGNGNPIYNKDTGAILRDPITGVPV